MAVVDASFEAFDQLIVQQAPDVSCTAPGKALVRQDLPTPEARRHGTYSAQMVLKMAPKATLFLVRVDNVDDADNATRCLHAAGVSIITSSLEWDYDSPGDGRGDAASVNYYVTRATSPSGIPTNGYNMFWTNAAGNRQQNHFKGNWRGAGGNDPWHIWPDGQHTLPIVASSGDTIHLDLRWQDNWGASYSEAFDACSEYDLWLFSTADGWINYATQIQNAFLDAQCQQGGTRKPHVSIDWKVPASWGNNRKAYIGVYKWLQGAPPFELQSRNHYFWSVFGDDGFDRVTDGSISTPADNESGGFMAVGAARTSNPDRVTEYSGLGPNWHGTIKPDLTGPTEASTFDNGIYPGTSAATPHIGGLAALIKQAHPFYNPTQIKTLLNLRTVDIEAPGWDSRSGSGRAHLGAPPLGAGLVVPSSGATRIFDTRTGFGGGGLTLNADESRRFLVAPDIYAMYVNVTVAGSCCGGFVTVYPGDLSTRPLASTLNPSSNPSHNLTLIQIPKSGPNANSFIVYSTGQLDVIIDRVAYWSTNGSFAGHFHTLTSPLRVLDTRPMGTCSLCTTQTIGYAQGSYTTPIAPAPMQSGGRRSFQITGPSFPGGTVPNTAVAIFLHVTVVQTGPSPGFVTVEPYNAVAGVPLVSTVNPSTAIAFNGWITALNEGAISIYATGTPFVAIDVLGYWQGEPEPTKGGLTPITPVRVLDTRADSRIGYDANGNQIAAGPFSGALTFRVDGKTFAGVTIPEDATALIFNITTATDHAGGGFVVVYPTSAGPPNASMVNPVKPLVSSLAAVRVPLVGNQAQTLSVHSSDSINVIIDLVGYSRDTQ